MYVDIGLLVIMVIVASVWFYSYVKYHMDNRSGVLYPMEPWKLMKLKNEGYICATTLPRKDGHYMGYDTSTNAYRHVWFFSSVEEWEILDVEPTQSVDANNLDVISHWMEV